MGRQGHLVADAGPVATAARRGLSLIPSGAAIIIGLSGGPDSTALAMLVGAVRPDLAATAVHVRHGLRNDALDAAAAEQVAAAAGVPFVEVAVTVAGEHGIEADARRARYDALARSADELGADWVLVAHTADDQAETVLLNVARGAGLAGAAGMRAVRPLGRAQLLRPLLEVRRGAVRAIAQQVADAGIALADDPMNIDPDRRRTRVRTEALPALGSLTGGATDPVLALTRLAAAARSDDAALTAIADEMLEQQGRSWGPVTAIAWDALDAAPPAVAARVVRRLATPDSEDPGGTAPWPTAQTTARILALAPGRSVQLPGGRTAARSAGWLTVAPAAGAPSFAIDLPAARDSAVAVAVPAAGVAVELRADAASGLLPFWAPASAAATVPAPGAALSIRPARRDDVIATDPPRSLAAAIRATVPSAARPYVIVVADPDGPVWVPGVAVRAGLRPTAGGYLRVVRPPAHAG